MLSIAPNQTFSAVCRDTGLIDIVAIGADSQMYHKAWSNAHWHEWENLGGNFAAEAPALVASSKNRLDVFARDKASKVLMHSAWSDDEWATEWDSSDDQKFEHRFVAQSWEPGRVDVFGTTDDQMYHRALVNGSWQGEWEYWFAPFQSNLALTSWSTGHLDVFGVGNNTQMWQKTYDSTAGGWRTPPLDWQTSQVPNGTEGTEGDFASDPSIVSWPSHQLHLLVVGSKGKRSDAALYRAYVDGEWTDYKDIGGTFTSPMSAVAWSEGRLDVVGRGTDSDIWHRSFDSKDGKWQPHWKALGGGTFGSSPVIVAWGRKRLDVFAAAQNDSSILQLSGNGNTWGNWSSIGQLPDRARVTPFASDDAWPSSTSAVSSSGLNPWAPSLDGSSVNYGSPSAATSNSEADLSTGAVAGIAVGACVAAALVAIAVLLILRHRKKNEAAVQSNGLQMRTEHRQPAMFEASAHRSSAAIIHELHEDPTKFMPMSRAVADNSGVHELETAGGYVR